MVVFNNSSSSSSQQLSYNLLRPAGYLGSPRRNLSPHFTPTRVSSRKATLNVSNVAAPSVYEVSPITRLRHVKDVTPSSPRAVISDFYSPWLEDARFSKSKIYQRRLAKAATKIQAAARRWLLRDGIAQQRKVYDQYQKDVVVHRAASHMQRMVRGHLARVLVHRERAIIPIQALVRRHQAGQKKRVLELEQKLARIQAAHQEDLMNIRQEVAARKTRLLLKAQKISEKEATQHRLAEKIIAALRKDNRKIRLSNQDLAQKMHSLRASNKKLERDLLFILARTKLVQAQVDEWTALDPKLKEVNTEFDTQMAIAKENLVRAKYRTQFEENCRVAFEGGLEHIIQVIQDSKDAVMKESLEEILKQ